MVQSCMDRLCAAILSSTHLRRDRASCSFALANAWLNVCTDTCSQVNWCWRPTTASTGTDSQVEAESRVLTLL